MISIFSNNLSLLAKQHYASIIELTRLDAKYKNIFSQLNYYIEIITNSEFNFEKLITAPPPELDKIVNYLNSSSEHRFSIEIKNIYNTYFSSSTAVKLQLDGDNYSSYHFVKRLGIKVCPYCNRNYIFNVPSKDEGKRRLSELDHYYNKQKYPLLAMSFFNLVPVCHNCNHIKHASVKKFINPYSNFNSDDLIIFELFVKQPDFIFNAKSYKIKFKTSVNYKEMFYELKLDRIYPIHKEIVNDIIIKKYIYNSNYINDIYEKLKNDLKLTPEDFLNTILSANIQEEKLKEKPFSKLTKDIWKDLDPKIHL